MMPFKQKPNSILKNIAVLLILICISDSSFSYLQDIAHATEESQRVINAYQRQVAPKDQTSRSDTVLQRKSVEVSPYVRDVRADSRQSRIDSRDIRTDFREIRTELRSIGNIRGNRQEVRNERQSRIIRDQRIPMAAGHRDNSRQREIDSREYQTYSRQGLQRQLLDRRSQESSMDRREFDSARHNKLRRELSKENRNREPNLNNLRQIREKRFERLSEDRRVVREHSRDKRNIQERAQEKNDRRQGSNEPRQIQDRRLELLSVDRRVVRENSLDNRNIRERSQVRRDRQETDNESRQIRDKRLERLSEDRRVVRDHSRDNRNVQERSNNRKFTSIQREETRNIRNNDQLVMFGRHDVREHARRFRNIHQERFNDRRTRTNDDQSFNSQARRDFREYSRRTRDGQECSIRQRNNEIALDRRGNVRECYRYGNFLQRRDIRQNLNRQHRDIRENVQQNLRVHSDVRENREFPRERLRSLDIREDMRLDNRRESDRSNNLQDRRNKIEMSRDSHIASHRRADLRQDERRYGDNTREWSQTLRETGMLTRRQDERREHQSVEREISRELSDRSRRIQEERRERQSVLQERREINRELPENSRRIQEDRREFTHGRNSAVVGRRTEESRIRQITERREDSRTNSRQQAKRREALEEVRYRREVGKRLDDFERRERFIGQRQDITRDFREVERRNIPAVNSRRDLNKDTRAFEMGDLQNAEFIPNFKEKSDILSSTLQAVLIIALFGQLFFNTSKNRLGFPSWQNIFGKEKVL